MTPEEFARARRLIQADRGRAAAAADAPAAAATARGTALDVRGLVRASLATGGDPVERAFRSRGDAPRKLVLILDVSGSMEAYARALLLYLHAARGSGRGVETFAFGTRLTRLTAELGDARSRRRRSRRPRRASSTGRAARASARRSRRTTTSGADAR